jgi:hypothetical protein
MILNKVQSLLAGCSTEKPYFPPTILYNEGWMLRLILDCFSTLDIQGHQLTIAKGCRWYSEALLPSAFLPRSRSDSLAESWTHADGVIGDFQIGKGAKANLVLSPAATHFVVLEAKMFSKLSSGVKNASYFDQAARNIACMAEVLRLAERSASECSSLGFYVLAPKSQIDRRIFEKDLNRDSIKGKVEKRAKEYRGKDDWFSRWFIPTLDRIKIEALSWEELIDVTRRYDPKAVVELEEFYKLCLQYNNTEKIDIGSCDVLS